MKRNDIAVAPQIRRCLILAMSLSLGGCVAFNSVCASDDSEVVGRSDRSLELRQEALALRESPLGNMIADAMLAAVPEAEAALFPAGYVSDQTQCGSRELLVRGDIRANDLADLLPNDDALAIVSLPESELSSTLEHGVAALSSQGTPALSPAFLHVSRLFFSVDCSGTPQRVSPDGRSVLSEGSRVVSGSLLLGNNAVTPGQTIRLVVPQRLLTGLYGFAALTQPGRLLSQSSVTLRAAVTRYIRANSPINPQVEGRATLRESCR